MDVNSSDDIQKVKIQQSSVDSIVTESLVAKQVSIANVNAGKARISQAGVGILRAHDVSMQKASAGLLKAKNVNAERINTLLCFSDSIEGEVKTVFSKESAIIFGISLGIVLSVLKTLRRVLR